MFEGSQWAGNEDRTVLGCHQSLNLEPYRKGNLLEVAKPTEKQFLRNN